MMSNTADNKLPLVSIGVPTFNRPAELKRVLGQLINQVYSFTRASVFILAVGVCPRLFRASAAPFNYQHRRPGLMEEFCVALGQTGFTLKRLASQGLGSR